MDQVCGSGQAKLRVFLVVPGVRHVVRVDNLQHSWIFDASLFFIVGFRRKDRLIADGEVNTIDAGCISDARCARSILLAVEQDGFAPVSDRRRIKRACGGRTGGGRRNHRSRAAPLNRDLNGSIPGVLIRNDQAAGKT